MRSRFRALTPNAWHDLQEFPLGAFAIGGVKAKLVSV